MKDPSLFGWHGLEPAPLAALVTIVLLGLVWVSCQKAAEPLTTTAMAAENPAAGGGAQPVPSGPTEIAVLAGGCFWGMEEILREVPGVIDVENGYTGGFTPHPRYMEVHTGATGHAEAVRVVFDPSKITYAELLEKWFFKMHDPTTRNRQGNDIGTQYRSAIFYTSPEQRKIAEEVKSKVQASGFWKRPLTTEISSAGPFTLAEEEHQDYLEKHPGGYTCHFIRD